MTDAGAIEVEVHSDGELKNLYGVKTDAAGKGLLMTAIDSLGNKGELYRSLMAAMPAEMEPQDAVEAMLVNQKVATNAALAMTSRRMMDSDTLQRFEVYERAATRLARTFISQAEALKKYRAKAQQVVRVERVTVQDGGQAIVGSVIHGGGDDEKNDGNPMQRAHAAQRCAARSKRTGFLCKNPAVRGWRVCRAHGAGAGMPSTNLT